MVPEKQEKPESKKNNRAGNNRADRWTALPSLKTVRLQQAQLFTLLAIPLIPLGLHRLWFSLTELWTHFATRVLRWGMGIPQYEFPVSGLLTLLMQWLGTVRSVADWVFGLAHILDVVAFMALIFFAAPYVLDWILPQFYGLQPHSMARLAQTSPEAQRHLQTICNKQKIPLPQLGRLSTAAPIVFSYGSLGKNTRIVISQGLLDQLDEAEIASLIAAEISYVSPLNMGLLTGLMAILQIPYLIYWLTANIGDRLMDWAEGQDNRAIDILGRIAAYGLGAVSTIGYVSFWIMRWAGLVLTRRRSAYGDQAASNQTGNPNAQATALIKLSQGISQDIRQRGHTDFLLEGWELLMPVGYRQALSAGSLVGKQPVEELLEWDLVNPARQVLVINNSHARLGDRLSRLMYYAQTWRLSPEFSELASQPSQRTSWGQLLWTGIPFGGAAIGYGIALMLWAIAWVLYLCRLPQMAWLGSDFKLFYGLPLIGFGLGTFLRFNQYFPDLPASWQRQSPAPTINFADAIQDSQAHPNNARPTVLSGKLLGRRGLSNLLGQDLILQNDGGGLVRLHLVRSRPASLVGQSISAIGWLRRGATPWVDVEILRTNGGQVVQGGHQISAVVIGAVTIVLGLTWLGTWEDIASLIQKARDARPVKRR
jgi:Zn-dependent protease with chaperone function